MAQLTGKTILVTGGARGIGAAIARACLDEGADVILHYAANRTGAEDVAARAPDRCHLLQADFALPATASPLWQQAVSWKGHIDVLVNNAGVFEPTGVDDGPDAWLEAWQRTLQINLIAAADLCREAILHFKSRGGGSIINISSRAAFRGDTPDYMHYAASKSGMIGLTRSIARGYGADKILAYVIAPGFVRTEMAETFIRANGEAAITDEIPLGELATPEDVAAMTVFLASGKARHSTGATFDINGASYVR
jgi:3-oxoacyl-[acyl-carrier protein] reductase